MTPIQINTLHEPGVVRRHRFAESPVTFGRDADNTLIIPVAYVSRRHGELRFAQGQWVLVNQSPNGTVVNGRRAGRRPHRLSDRDVVAVGDQRLFEVRLEAPAPGSPGSPATAEQDESGAAAPVVSGRTKLWAAIGIFWIVVAAVGVMLGMLTRGTNDGSAPAAPELSRQEIAAAVRQPLPKLPLDERAAQEALTEANELYNRLDSAPDAPYRAYLAYRRALAHQPDVEGYVLRRYQTLEDQLVEEVSQRYKDAYALLKSQQFREAHEEFRKLNQFYPDPRSAVFRNVEQQRKVAAQGMRRRRG